VIRDDDPIAPARGVVNGLAVSLVLWAVILVALREVILWAR